RAYALGEGDALLATNPWYEELAPEAERRQALWREFLLGEDAKEEIVRKGDWVLGSEAFRRRPRQEDGRPVPRGRGRRSQSRQTGGKSSFMPQGEAGQGQR